MVPEKVSSFKIHPHRCCSDVCYYCGLKFGMLDTPLHILQLKTAEIQSFATSSTGFKGDACLCDKCYRYIDRRARADIRKGRKTDDDEASDSNGELNVGIKTCVIRNCNREVSFDALVLRFPLSKPSFPPPGYLLC